MIDELLTSPGYGNHLFNFWADILRLNENLGGGPQVTPKYIEWLHDALAENVPYDEMVWQLITGEGAAYENGAMGYTFRDRGMPLDHMANTVRIFLGTRLECAQCHDHSFDKWTQMDFFQTINSAKRFEEMSTELVENEMERLGIVDRRERLGYQSFRRASMINSLNRVGSSNRPCSFVKKAEQSVFHRR